MSKLNTSNNDNEAVLTPLTEETFRFECYPGISCFTRCCQGLKLYLTPYDIIRLTAFLQLTSQEFIDKYTEQEPDGLNGYPRLLLKMREQDSRCPFVTEKGCSVYTDRPSSCRFYPIGRATRKKPFQSDVVEEWFFTVREKHCLGFEENKEWTVSEWIENQGVAEYNKLNDLWMEIVLRQPIISDAADRERKMQMFYMSSYQLDEFSNFVFKSGFLKRFNIIENEIEKIRDDVVELNKFAIRWLKFSLFGERTISFKT